MSNLSDIGFPTPDEQSINEMIMHVLEVAKPAQNARGFYLVYTDSSGAEIYLQGNFNQELVGFNPHFAGKSRRRVGLTRAIERDSSDLDGGFHAWANPSDENVDVSGEYPFVFDVPDFRAVEIADLPRVAEIQLTAFASNDFKVYASEEDYQNAQDSELKYAPKMFVPVGLFDFNGKDWDENDPPRPVGKLAGEIREFELKTNELSGEKFYWLLVETHGGAVDVVVDPKYVPDEPVIGGTVSGTFWLSGKIL
ncbi:MAG TPA: hypothetical protein VIL74_24900 [Pyrinomonadaceae bacterium]|jgi:hypothetical protein